jgi:hypothetical protein
VILPPISPHRGSPRCVAKAFSTAFP